MPTPWVNPCGGTAWRYLDDGSIELESGRTPLYEPGSASFRNLELTWQNWHCDFSRAARRYGVPVSWLVAIASVESGGWADEPAEQASIASPAGAIGVMQIMPSTGRMYGVEASALSDPAVNIDIGAELIADIDARVRGGLPAITGPYNSGKLCCQEPACARVGCQNDYLVCTDGNYPGLAIAFNNSAIRFLALDAPCLTFAGALGLGALLAVAGAFVIQRRR